MNQLRHPCRSKTAGASDGAPEKSKSNESSPTEKPRATDEDDLVNVNAIPGEPPSQDSLDNSTRDVPNRGTDETSDQGTDSISAQATGGTLGNRDVGAEDGANEARSRETATEAAEAQDDSGGVQGENPVERAALTDDEHAELVRVCISCPFKASSLLPQTSFTPAIEFMDISGSLTYRYDKATDTTERSSACIRGVFTPQHAWFQTQHSKGPPLFSNPSSSLSASWASSIVAS